MTMNEINRLDGIYSRLNYSWKYTFRIKEATKVAEICKRKKVKKGMWF